MRLNLCALVGCLARDPHTSWEGEGKQVTGLTLKVQKPHSTFVLYVPVQCFGKSAEQAALLEAETLVSVEGHLGYKSYVDTQGEKCSTIVVIARQITVLQSAEVPV